MFRVNRTVDYEQFPSQIGVHFTNRLLNSIKSVPKAFQTYLKSFLASAAFYCVDDFLMENWETTIYFILKVLVSL